MAQVKSRGVGRQEQGRGGGGGEMCGDVTQFSVQV